MSELVWRAGLDDTEIAAVHELASAATQADGVAPLSDHVLRHLGRGGTEAAHLVARDGANLVGFAHLDRDDPVSGDGAGAAGGSGELTVHPQARRVGLGAAMVRELGGALPAGATLRLWAHGDHPGAVALAARLDFRRVRELLQLRLAMTEPPVVPQLPAGVRIRAFRAGADEAEFLRVNNAAFDWHPEQGGWVPAEITERELEPWFDPAGFLLAVDAEDRLLGYHWTKVHPAVGATEALGEVYVLGVDPSARGLHLGRTLTLAGLRHLHDRGLRTVLLYVEADNASAVELYENLGFTRWHTDVVYSKDRWSGR